MQVSRFQHLTPIVIMKGLSLHPYLTYQLPNFHEYHNSSTCNGNLGSVKESGSDSPNDTKVILPPAPTNCCMSGCQNCVWLAYAEELKKTLYCSSSEKKDIILKQIDDPNMRAFLKLELTFMDGDCHYRPTCRDESDS